MLFSEKIIKINYLFLILGYKIILSMENISVYIHRLPGNGIIIAELYYVNFTNSS